LSGTSGSLSGTIKTGGSSYPFRLLCYQEALAIIERTKPVVLALARALIDHPQRTLDGSEIDAIIGAAIAAQSIEEETNRRLDWQRRCESAASFADLSRERA
jgi:hypothetical protein